MSDEAVQNNPRRRSRKNQVKEELKRQLKEVTPDTAEAKLGSTFQEKVEKVQKGTKFYQGLQRLWKSMKDHGMGWDKRLAALGAIVYFIIPADLIPDWIPYLGYLDDIAVVGAALAYIGKDSPCAAVSPERLIDEAERIHDEVHHGKSARREEPEEDQEHDDRERHREYTPAPYNRTLDRMRRRLNNDRD